MTEDFNLQKIIDLEPGWEKEWDKLYYQYLVYDASHDYAKGPLTRYAEYRFSCSDDSLYENIEVDHFIEFANEYYLKRIRKQNLFAAFDPEKGNAIAFLSYPLHLDGILKQYRSQRFKTNTSLLQSSDSENDSDNDEPDFMDHNSYNSDKVIFKQKIQQLFAALQENIIIHFRKTKGGHITRDYAYAGLQYYPRLSQMDEPTVNLYEYVQNKVAAAQTLPAEEADALIKEHHEQETSILIQSLVDISKKMDAMRYHKGSQSFRNDSNSYFEIFKKIYLYPLDVPCVMFLLKIDKRNTVDKYHSDYIAALPVILKNYKDTYEQIKNDTYIPGDFKEQEDDNDRQ